MATTKPRNRAKGRQQQAPDPRETAALRELGHVCAPKSFEHITLDIPDHLRVTATITVGELENGNWVWGLDAESLETKRESHLVVPCELAETPDGYTSAHYTRTGALKAAVYELYEWAEDECWPRGALHAIKLFHIPPGATSTTTPAGIAVNDPEAHAPETAASDRQQKLAAHWKLTVDPEFQAAQRPLSKDERERLKESLEKHGCRDPIVVCDSWEGFGNGKELVRYVIDGHNRYKLCQELRLPFAIVRVRLPDRAAVLEWIRSNQLARRNLTPEERDALLAREYRAEVERRKTSGAKRKMDAQAATGGGDNGTRGQGDKGKPHAETVTVPFSSGHPCLARFALLELDGRWYAFETSTNAGGGAVTSYKQSEVGKLTAKYLKETHHEGFRNRKACLLHAADDLIGVAERQGKKYWPSAALKELRAWRDSLTPNTSKKAAAVVAEKHGVSPATVKRAAKVDREADAAWTRIADVTRVSRAEVQALVPRAKAAVLASLPTAELGVALRDRSNTGVRQAIEHAQQRVSRKAAKAQKRPKLEHELRNEAQRHIERYLDTLAETEAWAASDRLLDALNQWRGRHAPKSKTAKRKPR